MLMISRRAGERLVIDGDIEVVVTEIRRRSVRIGVSGGEGKLIVRGEVHDAIVAANRSAADVSIDDAAFDDLFQGPPYSTSASDGAAPEGREDRPSVTSGAPEAP